MAHETLIIIIAAYLILVFVLSRIIIPFMRWKANPSRIPQQLVEGIAQLESESTTPYEYVVAAEEYILSQNYCNRISPILKLPLAFETDVKKLFSRRGFMHCTQINHLMRLLLVKSNFFVDTEVRLQTTFLNFSIHQYIQVLIAGQWYDVDLTGNWMGVPLGKHAWGFR